MIRPFLDDMTLSELHAVMTGGFSTIAGSVLGAYISFGVSCDDPDRSDTYDTWLFLKCNDVRKIGKPVWDRSGVVNNVTTVALETHVACDVTNLDLLINVQHSLCHSWIC